MKTRIAGLAGDGIETDLQFAQNKFDSGPFNSGNTGRALMITSDAGMIEIEPTILQGAFHTDQG